MTDTIPSSQIQKRIRINLDDSESYAYVRDGEKNTVTLTADLDRFKDRERVASLLLTACDDLAAQLIEEEQ